MVGSIHIYRVNDFGAILEGGRDESRIHANSQLVSHSLNLKLATELGWPSLCPQVSAQSYILLGGWILLLLAAPSNWQISGFLTLLHSGPLCTLTPCLERLSLLPSGGRRCPTDPAQFTDAFSMGHMVLLENFGFCVNI